MQYHAIPCNTMQYIAIPCNTMQYHAIPCNTMQYQAIPFNTMQYHAIPCLIYNCWRSVPLPCGQYMAIFRPIPPSSVMVKEIVKTYRDTKPEGWSGRGWIWGFLSKRGRSTVSDPGTPEHWTWNIKYTIFCQKSVCSVSKQLFQSILSVTAIALSELWYLKLGDLNL